MREMHAFLSPGSGLPLLLIPEYSGINKEQRIHDRSKTAHRKPPVNCFLTVSTHHRMCPLGSWREGIVPSQAWQGHTQTQTSYRGAEKPCAWKSRVYGVYPPTAPGAEGDPAASAAARCMWPEGGQLPGSSICAAPLGLLAAFCLPLQAQFQLSQQERRKPTRNFNSFSF